LARTAYIANLPRGADIAAATAVFETLTRYILQALRVLFAIGVVMLFAAWVSGPSTAATWIRNVWNRLLGRGGAGIGNNVDLGPVPSWLASHLVAVRSVIIGLAVVALVFWTRPTGKVVLLIAVLTLIPLALAQLLANSAAAASEAGSSSAETEEPTETVDAGDHSG
jgi:hypothetical protein